MRTPNYIRDINKFQLAGPPDYFLRQLWDFDPSLAIVPSRQGFYYRLAQRRKLNLPEKVVNEVLREEADTRMLATHGLVPVTTILSTANWSNPLIFVELARRAPWRNGGADKYTQMVEDQDYKDRLDKAVQQDANLTDLAKDSWKYYQKKVGLRSHMYSPKTKGPLEQTSQRGITRVSKKQAYRPEIVTAWGDVLKQG